jgi:hypothetical protein
VGEARIASSLRGFAHTLNASLSKQLALDLYNSLSIRLRGGLKASYKAMGVGDLTSPSSLESRDLQILVFLGARQAIKAAVHAVRDGKA